MPRTFQGRLTVAFVAVIALTLLLVFGIVLNRLDDYFANQQEADLDAPLRHGQPGSFATIADEASARCRPVVGLDGTVDADVVATIDVARLRAPASPTSSARRT